MQLNPILIMAATASIGSVTAAQVPTAPPMTASSKVKIVNLSGADATDDVPIDVILNMIGDDEGPGRIIQWAFPDGRGGDDMPPIAVTLRAMMDGAQNDVLLRRFNFDATGAEERREDAAFLGVSTEAISSETAAQLPIRRGTGLLVTTVTEGSPAAAAGLTRLDVLAKLDDQLLINSEQLAALIRSYQPGDAVTLTVYRGGREQRITTTLGSRLQPVLGPGGRRASLGFDDDMPISVMLRDENSNDLAPRLVELIRGSAVVAPGAAGGDALHRSSSNAGERTRGSAVAPPARGSKSVSSQSNDGGSAQGSASGSTRDSGGSSRSSSSNDTSRMVRQARDSASSSSRTEQIVWDDGTTRIERTRGPESDLVRIVQSGREMYRGPMPHQSGRGALPTDIQRKLAEFEAMAIPTPPSPPPAPPAPRAGSAATPPPPPPPPPPAP
ncbi:MAG: PDZ domain-containing protein [Phycisphaeraceae bacterium]|nr:PDZ domain-containing protein [Phycisphaeraceae bacterium]